MGRRRPVYYYPNQHIQSPPHKRRDVLQGVTYGMIIAGLAVGYSEIISPGGGNRTTVPSASSTPKPGSTPSAKPAPQVTPEAKKKLVVVIDPGHGIPAAGTKDVRDAQTGYRMADYKNSPETKEVYDVALLVKKMLEGSFDVHFTKQSVDEGPSLRKRAEAANELHPDLVVSIHTDHTQPNSMQWVIPQTVGKTRGINSVADGTRQLTFTETKTACMSKAYAEKIVTARAAASGIPTQLHDLNFTTKNKDGSIFNNINRAPGDISWVQLLSPSTPWVYNEFGGKVGSNETVELSQTEKEQYATGLASGIREALELRDTFLQKCQ